MPQSATPRFDRFPRLMTGLAAAGAIAVLALTGCSSNPVAAPASASATSPAAPDATSSAMAPATDLPVPTESATPTPTPTPSGDPVGLTCDQVLSPKDVYAFNPNFGTAPNYKPSGLAASAPSYGGVACGWLNQSSGAVLEVAVAKPVGASLEDLKNKAALSGKAVPTYGTPPAVEAYFSKSGDTGTTQVFMRGYWVVASSVEFFEPGDAQKLIDLVQHNLP